MRFRPQKSNYRLNAEFSLKEATVCLRAVTELAQFPNRRSHQRRHYQLKTSASCGPGTHIWKSGGGPDVRNDHGRVHLKYVLMAPNQTPASFF